MNRIEIHDPPLASPNAFTCEVCLKEVPKAETTVREATDYFTYFCGLDCYETWKKQAAETAAATQESRS